MEKLEIDENNLLYRRTISDRKQLLFLNKLRSLVYIELHVKMGHLRSRRTVELKNDFTGQRWQNMWITLSPKQETKKHYSWSPHKKYDFIITTSTGRHWLSTFRSLQWRLWIPASHHRPFTRFVQVYETTDRSARTTAEKLHNDFMMRYGIPEKLLSDRGTEFENELFQRLSKLRVIKKKHALPHTIHKPMGKWNKWIRLSSTCWNVYQSNTKVIGATMWINWFMQKTVRKVQQLAIPNNTIYLADTQDYPDVLLPSQSSHTSSYPEYAKKWKITRGKLTRLQRIIQRQERRKISIDIIQKWSHWIN